MKFACHFYDSVGVPRPHKDPINKGAGWLPSCKSLLRPTTAVKRGTNYVSEQEIHVCFLTPDANLAQALTGVLGAGFSSRVVTDFQIARFNEVGNWCDVLVVDLRAPHPGTVEGGLRFIHDVTTRQTHPPVVVLYHEETPGLNLKVMELG